MYGVCRGWACLLNIHAGVGVSTVVGLVLSCLPAYLFIYLPVRLFGLYYAYGALLLPGQKLLRRQASKYIAGRHSSLYAGCEEWVDNWVGGSSGRPGLRSDRGWWWWWYYY
ncbi:uncharacterized protein BO87DRAFT_414698 [Aspergillus neoniger CBS 115656]|uniref:Uncharacterized protein n=1 Tax=Aspergillus neoniger (strain CBS 115656) TaxID=1448310 RepID=A0A318YPE6_ASPNB|nr:hypothetical protein BO87DRAFT_414698 [Aspergillus neoniger CBS 115656]PYH36156.1 hypothetical protein BO87DRAFT_414698 [Aspergillus neoniger CBS 115656]